MMKIIRFDYGIDSEKGVLSMMKRKFYYDNVIAHFKSWMSCHK